MHVAGRDARLYPVAGFAWFVVVIAAVASVASCVARACVAGRDARRYPVGGFASFVVVMTALVASGCPGPIPPPVVDPPPPVAITARVADGAPIADASDAPDVVMPAVPASANVVVVDVGLVALTDGVSADILVDVTCLGSMAVLVYGHDGAHVILERAQAPDGTVIVNDVAPPDVLAGLADEHLQFARGFPAQVFSKNRVFASAVNGSFLVPNTSDLLVGEGARDGRWILRVSQWNVDSDAEPPVRTPLDRPVHVIIVARGGDSGQGRVDLNVRFAGNALRAADASNDVTLQTALDVVRDAYAGAGIDVREVRFIDHPTPFPTVELDAPCEAGDLFELAKSARDLGGADGADIFLIDNFVCLVGGGVDLGNAIAGIAAGVPGPPFVRGSEHAGVAVRYRELGDAEENGRELGVVIAHELAHFLGLYHTREASFFNAPPIFDEIADSPDGDDADENLMFFGADENITLSEGQARVLRTSPLVIAEL